MENSTDRPHIPFDEIQPGDALGPVEYELSAKLVERHRRATEQEPYPDPELERQEVPS